MATQQEFINKGKTSSKYYRLYEAAAPEKDKTQPKCPYWSLIVAIKGNIPKKSNIRQYTPKMAYICKIAKNPTKLANYQKISPYRSK